MVAKRKYSPISINLEKNFGFLVLIGYFRVNQIRGCILVYFEEVMKQFNVFTTNKLINKITKICSIMF